MTDYQANVTADFSGYTSSVQQAMALTKEYTAAHEGMMSVVTKTGAKAILKFNDMMGVTAKVTKANVAEAANYQQVLGKVSASAKAAGENVGAVQKATKSVARTMTGDIKAATELVSEIQKSGFTDPKKIKEMSKAVVELGAATGESGTEIASSLNTIQASYGKAMDPKQIANLGDSLVKVTSQFGASASAAASFSKNVAPFAQQIGMSQSSLVGFSTAFARMGESGYRSSNVFAKVLSDVDLAVREGLPTMGTYATAMGKTYAEAMKLAKDNPTEFVVQFTEALQKQGSEGIRTLEALGLEGVRSQKAISALTSGTDLRDMVKVAQESYGGGATGEAAAEQLGTLNEQTALLQESMKELVVTTGKPMLGWLEDITSLSAKAADGMAAMADSPIFQFIAGTGGLAMAGTALAFKGINAAWTAGGIGAAMGQINAMGQKPGEMGRVEKGMSVIGANRGKLMGAGLAGMMLSPMLDQPGLGTAGMMAMMAGTLIGPQTFQKTQRAMNFLTQDAMAAWQTPFTDWKKGKFGLEDRVRATDFIEGEGFRAARGGATSTDQFALARKKAKEIGGLEDLLDDLNKSQGVINPKTKKQFGANFTAEILDALLQETPDVGKARAAGRSLATGAETLIAGGTQTAGLRAGVMARQAGGIIPAAGRGLATQVGAIAPFAASLGAPMLIAGAGVAAVGAGLWLNKKADEREEARRSRTITGREEAYERFGKVAATFDGITSAGDRLTGTFDNLSQSIEKNIAAQKGGETRAGVEEGGTGLTSTEFAAIDISKGANKGLTFQNYRLGPLTFGSQVVGAQQTSELLGTYGTKGTPENIAMIATDLKAAGKSLEEVDAAVMAYRKATEGGLTGVIQHGITDYLESAGSPVWEEETWDDVIKGAFADYGGTTADQALMTSLVGEAGKAAATGKYSEKKINDMMKDFSDAFGFEAEGAMPEFVTPGMRKTSETDEEWEARKEEARQENQRRTDAWLQQQYGRPIGKLETGLVGMLPGEAEGGLWGRMQTEARRQTYMETGVSPGGLPAGGPQSWAAIGTDQAAANMANTFIEVVQDWEEGQTGKNLANTEIMAKQFIDTAGGDVAGALKDVREMQQAVAPESAQGQMLAMVEASLGERRGIEIQGMGRWQGLQARGEDYRAMVESAGAAIQEGETGPEVQAQLEEGAKGMKQVMAEKVGFMQDYLRAYQGFQNQQRYAEEDYNRSVQYAEQDYATQRRQATEQYQKSVRYATEDHHKQMRYMEEDYQKTQVRAERDYLKQRDRMAAEYAKNIARRAEDAAKAMYDPFQRMAVEQTWSAEGLLSNLTEQLEAFQEQAENLNKLRGMGVNQSVIDMLGLNDPQKAQQLERMLGDLEQMPNGADIIAELNANVGERTDIAGVLFGEENDLGARRMAEDYATQLGYMSADRDQWLADSAADYATASQRAEEAFITSMTRMREGFDTQMKYMSEAHVRAMERMAQGHATAMQRAQESFTLQFQTFTTNYEALAAEMTHALEGKPVEWGKITKEGTAGVIEELKKGYDPANKAWMDSLVASVEAAWGKDSNSSKVINAVVSLLGMAGKEGGPAGTADWPTTTTAEQGEAYSGGETGLLDVLGGRGRVSQMYGVGSGYASKDGTHTGVDVSAPGSPPVYATVSGKVVQAGWNSSEPAYGNSVIIDDAFSNTGLLYGHMSSVSVKAGDTVNRGAHIGIMGNTGRSFGAHVHVEARKEGPPGSYKYNNNVAPYQWMAMGGIVMGPTVTGMGERGPEAVIPLNSRGVDILAEALAKAYNANNGDVARGSAVTNYVSYTTNEDHSVNVNGPVEVVSADPERIGRELERAARLRSMVTPSKSR